MARRLFALATALVLVTSLTLAAFADNWDLTKGDINVKVDDAGKQTVHQPANTENSAAKEDPNPVISSNGAPTDNIITIDTAKNQTANITIDGVNASTDKSGIEVGTSSATIHVEGKNKVSSSGGAGIHVSSGNLTITGDGTLVAEGNNTSAGIGSGNAEEMSGSITIEGSATVTGSHGATGHPGGAGIGSGNNAPMTGDITIRGEATVTGESNYGAGIGSGNGAKGTMSGNITIEDNATATGSATTGAGIGSGQQGEMSGTITTDDNAKVTGTGAMGAGIGSGSKGEMSGNITIGGASQVTANAKHSTNPGAGIGSGTGFNNTNTAMSGNIAISTKATVEASSKATGKDATAGDDIGGGADAQMTGTIRFFDPPEDSDQAGKTTALYRVVDDSGISTGYKSELKEGVLTITVARKDANLTGTLSGLKTLTRWSVETIVFETESATSTFTLAELIAKGEEKDTYRLTHKAEEVTLTLNGEPLENILK